MSRRRVVIFTGALFSGNRELPTGRRGEREDGFDFSRGIGSEERLVPLESRFYLSQWFFFFVIVQKRNKFYQFSIGDTLSRSAF